VAVVPGFAAGAASVLGGGLIVVVFTGLLDLEGASAACGAN
jgi:hypothetical protein